MEIEDLLNADDGNLSKKESPLKSLETDLKLYNESLREVSSEIMAEGISAFPVFIAHQHKVQLGEPILDKDELNTEWSINASTMEELSEKGLILPDKQDRFIKRYKDAYRFMCVLVIVPEGANFVFYPYQE